MAFFMLAGKAGGGLGSGQNKGNFMRGPTSEQSSDTKKGIS
jgi:hypothetical protein